LISTGSVFLSLFFLSNTCSAPAPSKAATLGKGGANERVQATLAGGGAVEQRGAAGSGRRGRGHGVLRLGHGLVADQLPVGHCDSYSSTVVN
jgi:hypothetical protein